MEILSWVLEGTLEHQDSTGAAGTLRPNALQRMTAGRGVRHTEQNPSGDKQARFLQIWILPDRQGLKPEYEQRPFPRKDRQGRLRLLAAPKGTNGQVTIHQDVRLYDAALGIHETLRYGLPGDRYAWIQVLKGAIEINGKPLAQSDGAAVSEEDRLEIRATKAAEILLFDLA
jgi:redox-sensitive bicupin YhaK (pirin superfamily)